MEKFRQKGKQLGNYVVDARAAWSKGSWWCDCLKVVVTTGCFETILAPV
jgi:hypothetical protein